MGREYPSDHWFVCPYCGREYAYKKIQPQHCKSYDCARQDASVLAPLYRFWKRFRKTNA